MQIVDVLDEVPQFTQGPFKCYIMQCEWAVGGCKNDYAKAVFTLRSVCVLDSSKPCSRRVDFGSGYVHTTND